MKKYFFLLVIAYSLIFTEAVFASGKKSQLVDPPTAGGSYYQNTSYPIPFTATGDNPKNQAAISTGYYFVDSKCTDLDPLWHPTSFVLDTNYEANRWVRIVQGPHMLDQTNWPAGTGGINGYSFFRSWYSGVPDANGDNTVALSSGNIGTNPAWCQYWFGYDNNGNPNSVDTTDNAYAGPIPISGGGFVFNGVLYDSFYVSTNGIVALTNSRYNYASGSITKVPNGPGGDIFNRQSMDWFDVSRATSRSISLQDGPNGDGGADDATPDNFGFTNSVYNTANPQSTPFTILSTGTKTTQDLTSFNSGVAVIAPMWGDMQLSQWNPSNQRPEDWGKCYFKRSVNGDSLTIYWVNLQLKGYQFLDGNSEFGYFHSFTGYATILRDGRPDDGRNTYCAANVQLTLSMVDSTVNIIYENFDGGIYWAYRNQLANLMFLWNSVVGVRGFARHGNFDSKNPLGGAYAYNNIWDGLSNGYFYWPYVGQYAQTTHYFGRYLYKSPGPGFVEAQMSVRFKQWKNVLRVIGIKYMCKQPLPDTNPSYTDQYSVMLTSDNIMDKELLAGHKQLGSFQPVAIFQNLTNDIQGATGINYMPQDLSFQTRFVVTNQATFKTVYNRSVPINFTCLNINPNNPGFQQSDWLACNGIPGVMVRWVDVTNYSTNTTTTTFAYNGTNYTSFSGTSFTAIPPYSYTEVSFPPFVPSPLFDNHIGLMTSQVIGEPFVYNAVTHSYESLGDQWPFDDTLQTRFFVMRRIPNSVSFSDDVREYHLVQDIDGSIAPVPSVLKWVDFNAYVVPGDANSEHPLPPRGAFLADNSRLAQDPTLFPTYTIQSPEIVMDRYPYGSQDAANQYCGDQIRSYPIDMTGKLGAVLSLGIQRMTYTANWARGWCDGSLIGPEQRCTVGGDWRYTQNVGSQGPDDIRVEYAYPSRDGVENIAWLQGSDLNWDWLPEQAGNWALHYTGRFAYRLFGGGGYEVGYDENNYNLALPNFSGSNKAGLRNNVYDDGMDAEFNRVIMVIPDAFIQNIQAKANNAFNFRFRIRVNAVNNQWYPTSSPGIVDDFDPFFVDNIRILVNGPEDVDIECSSVKILWPYTSVPASQAIALPIRVTISNNTANSAPSFWVKVRIFGPGVQGNYDYTKPVYCRTIQQPFLTGGSTVVLQLPDWDARQNPPGSYRLMANSYIPYVNGDLEPLNDTTYWDFNLQYSDGFTYDLDNNGVLNTSNNVPDGFFGGIPGAGLDLFGFSQGGGVYSANPDALPADLPNYKREWEVGTRTGSGSGQIAMQFQVFQSDTIKGYAAYFGSLSQAPDQVGLVIYDGDDLPSQKIGGTEMFKARGYDDVRQNTFWDSYVTYLLPRPVILAAGKYWASISQQGETGIELGASAARVGMRCTDVYTPNPPGDGQFQDGSGSTFLLLDKDFRTLTRDGHLLNQNLFAYENTKGSGNWNKFMNTTGNPGFGHLDYVGKTPTTEPPGVKTWTLSRGTWIPMIYPYFGTRTYGSGTEYEPCGDTAYITPVEITYFNGQVRGSGIDLMWETAQEFQNYGFYVERAVTGANNGTNSTFDWKTIGFVKGSGTTDEVNHYNFTDNSNLEAHGTYDYRLRQVDLEGTQSCETYSEIVQLTYDVIGDLTLEQNTPNPFNYSTRIAFTLPSNLNVTLDVIDIFGNVVKTLTNGQLGASRYTFDWDGTDSYGNKVSNGTYIYRLIAGDEIKTGKMSFVR